MIYPDPNLLTKTGDVDYYDWNYRFPIKYVQRYRFRRILELLGNSRYSCLLEAGTGSGIFLPELSRHCDKLFALDKHSHSSAINKLLNHYKVTNCEFKSQSIDNTEYPDNFFDAIVAVSVLEFVDDLDAALAEIKRILKNNGFFITICPMNSKLLDAIVSLYTRKKPREEFGESRIYVGKALEKNFSVIQKGYLLPVFGNFFPIYTHFKLQK